MKYALLAFALVIGMYVGNVGTGSAPALIDSLSGMPRSGVLLLLGLVLFAAVWNFGTAIGRYHTSGDPKQVHAIDERTGARIPNAPSAARRREVD